ncbi:hypothetical protein PIROE2DRAFT_67816, partial [Piromyces sp. E2]
MEIKQNKQQYYELPVVPALYQIGVVYLAKYVSNYGNENYKDEMITFTTDIDELYRKLKENPSECNWYLDYYSENNPDPAKEDNPENNQYYGSSEGSSLNNPKGYPSYHQRYPDAREKIDPNYPVQDQGGNLNNTFDNRPNPHPHYHHHHHPSLLHNPIFNDFPDYRTKEDNPNPSTTNRGGREGEGGGERYPVNYNGENTRKEKKLDDNNNNNNIDGNGGNNNNNNNNNNKDDDDDDNDDDINSFNVCDILLNMLFNIRI